MLLPVTSTITEPPLDPPEEEEEEDGMTLTAELGRTVAVAVGFPDFVASFALTQFRKPPSITKTDVRPSFVNARATPLADVLERGKKSR